MFENKRMRYTTTALILAVLFSIGVAPLSPALSQDHTDKNGHAPSALSLPIKFFQRSVSKADGDRCPMYPSCSHYAAKAFKRHGAIKGWILSSDRLLRCGHDEIHLSPKVRVNGKTRIYDPVEANTRWWSKNFEGK